MPEEKISYTTDPDQALHTLAQQFSNDPNLLQYQTTINDGHRNINISIDIDPGGGFEGGYEATTFSAKLDAIGAFRFAIHEEDFLDEAGKLFGMQDVVLGYPDFDKHVVVKSNDDEKVKKIFSDETIRAVILTFDTPFSFAIRQHHLPHSNEKACYLELIIEKAVSDYIELKNVYQAFYAVLKQLS